MVLVPASKEALVVTWRRARQWPVMTRRAGTAEFVLLTLLIFSLPAGSSAIPLMAWEFLRSQAGTLWFGLVLGTVGVVAVSLGWKALGSAQRLALAGAWAVTGLTLVQGALVRAANGTDTPAAAKRHGPLPTALICVLTGLRRGGGTESAVLQGSTLSAGTTKNMKHGLLRAWFSLLCWCCRPWRRTHGLNDSQTGFTGGCWWEKFRWCTFLWSLRRLLRLSLVWPR
jgi:hypothetical protein